MRAMVDGSGCISCGLCVSICPDVFRLNNDAIAEAYAPVTGALKDAAQEARDGCPVSVISLEE